MRVLEPPLAPVPRLDGETSYRHVARWDTRACSPLTMMAPSRGDAPSLAATRNDTVADPCPDAGDSTEIQSVVVAASHTHSGCVVTASDPAPPAASSAAGAANVTPHFTGFGPWVIVEEVSQPETSTPVAKMAKARSVPRPVRLMRWTMRFTHIPQLHRREGRTADVHFNGRAFYWWGTCTINRDPLTRLRFTPLRRRHERAFVIRVACHERVEWWPGPESNQRHPHFQCGALPTELPGPQECSPKDVQKHEYNRVNSVVRLAASRATFTTGVSAGAEAPSHGFSTTVHRQGACWQSQRSSILSPACLQ